MRFLVFFFCFFLLPPVEAGAGPAKRKPANFGGATPARVLTFVCRENPDEPVVALGLAYLRVDIRDASAASVGLSLYVQTRKNSFASKTYQGAAAAVPGGFVMNIQGADTFTLNLHPNERTQIPGFARALACAISGSLASNP